MAGLSALIPVADDEGVARLCQLGEAQLAINRSDDTDELRASSVGAIAKHDLERALRLARAIRNPEHRGNALNPPDRLVGYNGCRHAPASSPANLPGS